MAQPATADLGDLEEHLAAHAEDRLRDYVEFLRIPSVGTLSGHADDMRRAAEFVADRLERMGVEHVEVSPTGGHPIVYGDWLHADGAPTAIVYGHYDVQPVDPLDEWVRPPFEPRVEDGRIYARGAADDKGQVHIHLSAAEAWLAVRGGFPLNLRFVFEGEEESGSAHLDTWLESNRERLSADVAVISDTGFFEGNVPAITIGLRGLMYAQIDVRGPSQDLHSGSFGGIVRNPANALATIIAGLHDENGRVTAPGFYDKVVELGPADRERIAQLPFDDARFARENGLHRELAGGERGYSPLERRGARPTLDVNGLWGGFQGEGSKTIIPSTAHAKISCRLVANQVPEEIFERVRARVLELAPSGVDVDVRLLNRGLPSLTPIDHPATVAAARSLAAVFGREPVYLREGGSIPIAASFSSLIGVPVVLLGFTNPDDQAHSPNENMVLDNYERGIRTVIRYWQELPASLR